MKRATLIREGSRQRPVEQPGDPSILAVTDHMLDSTDASRLNELSLERPAYNLDLIQSGLSITRRTVIHTDTSF